MKKIKLHPLLISLVSPLTLLAQNIGEINLSDGLRSLFISFFAATMLYLLFRVLTREWHKSAILTSLFLLWFVTYGYLHGILRFEKIAGLVGRHGFLLILGIPVFATLAWLVLKKVKETATLAKALAGIAIFMILIQSFLLVRYWVYLHQAEQKKAEISTVHPPLVPQDGTLPDIYYIILDSYARDDVLLNEYGYDNTAFLGELTRLGFYVARCSQSNYSQTVFSLATSLNLDYIPTILKNEGYKYQSTGVLKPFVQDSAVRQLLEAAGYTTIAFESGFYSTQWENADLYVEASPESDWPSFLGAGQVNNFEAMYLQTTAFNLLLDIAQELPLLEELVPEVSYPNRNHRQQVLSVLEHLQPDRVPAMPGPKLVFVHLVIPHAPFVFGPNGELVERSDHDPQGYRDEVTFLNQQITAIVKGILAHSDPPPVILIQGDHGAPYIAREQKTAILSAYYLPGADLTALYPAISPVNSFRVVFNQYFGGHYPLLEDASYHSYYALPYNFKEIPNARPGCEVGR